MDSVWYYCHGCEDMWPVDIDEFGDLLNDDHTFCDLCGDEGFPMD